MRFYWQGNKAGYMTHIILNQSVKNISIDMKANNVLVWFFNGDYFLIFLQKTEASPIKNNLGKQEKKSDQRREWHVY